MARGPSIVTDKIKHRTALILDGRKCTLKMTVLYRERLKCKIRKVNQK